MTPPTRKPLVPIACAYLFGLVLGRLFTYLPLSVIALFLSATLLTAVLRLRGRIAGRAFVLLPVALAGAIYMQAVTRYQPSTDVSGFIGLGELSLSGYLDAPPVHYPHYSSVTLRAQRVYQDHRFAWAVTGRVRLSGPTDALKAYRYEDEVLVGVSLKEPRGYLNPGLFNLGEYLRSQGITARATLRKSAKIVLLDRRPPTLLGQVYAWRERIRQAAIHSLHDEALAIFLAMIIGEIGHLSQPLRDHFMASGATHILSISGSHLALVAFVVFLVTRRAMFALPHRWLLRSSLYFTASQAAAALTLLPVTFYALLAGGQVATVRSLIMIWVYLSAVLIRREGHLLNSLALAALLVLLWDPQAIVDISFQLSYGAVLVIALTLQWRRQRRRGPEDPTGPPPGWLKRQGENFFLLFLMTAGVSAATAPLVAYYFNQTSWAGVFSNLLVVPLAGAVIVPLGLFSAIASLSSHPPALPLAGLVQGSYDLFYAAVKFFSGLPGALVHVPSPPLPLLVCLYLLPLLAFLMRRSTGLKRIAVGLAFCSFLAGAAYFSWPETARSLRIAFLDVGQGDSAVIQFPEGQVMVVDAGRFFGQLDAGRAVVAPWLWNRGIRQIDYLVASHPQVDHIGGFPFLIGRFDVREAWTNGVERDTEIYGRFQEALSLKGVPDRAVQELPKTQAVGPCRIDLLGPPGPKVVQKPDKALSSQAVNNLSVVLKITCWQYSFLFTGDAQIKALRQLARQGRRLGATVLKVPHHGSRSSQEPAFLSAVSPRIALISVGAYNPYEHPHPAVLTSYEDRGVHLFRTDRHGAIWIQAREDRLTLRQYSDWRMQPVRWNAEAAAMEWENLKKMIRPTDSLVLDKGRGVQ